MLLPGCDCFLQAIPEVLVLKVHFMWVYIFRFVALFKYVLHLYSLEISGEHGVLGLECCESVNVKHRAEIFLSWSTMYWTAGVHAFVLVNLLHVLYSLYCSKDYIIFF